MNAIFFDLDGTLVDSRADLAATVNHTRRDLALNELPLNEVLRHVGQGAAYLLANSIPERAGADAAELNRLFMSHYGEHMLDHCALYPTVRETLSALRERGCLLGINTAKPSFATHAVLEHLGIAEFFGDAVIAGGDCAEMKPSAMPLRECAARLGHTLTPDDWMVGDSWTDIKCAENAGVKSAFCAFGFGNRRDCVATLTFQRMDELLGHLC